jgi:hypothetical protein
MLLSFVIAFTVLGSLFIINQFIQTCIKCARLAKDYAEEEEDQEMSPEAKRMYV